MADPQTGLMVAYQEAGAGSHGGAAQGVAAAEQGAEVAHAGASAHAGAGAHTGGEGAHGGGIEHVHEIPNALTLMRNSVFLGNEQAKEVLHAIEPTFFALIAATLIVVIVRRATRRMTMVPGKLQNVVEMAIDAYDHLVCGIMGREQGRRYLPYVGSLFFFILFNNLMGLVPLFKAATSMYQTTLALGLCTFFYVQFHAIRMNGVVGYVYHLMGSPKGTVMWVMSPLMLVLEIVSEVIRPVSLSLRLFGNILGEDILLYVFSFLGVSMFAIGGIPIPIPLQFPFFFLAVLTSTVQALVFSLLSTIYITLFIPHGHGYGEH